jgi:peptidoglycan hydrolase-like protein with peptidoglycan-binding domain
MTTWKDLLKTANIQQSLARARTGLEEKTTYSLGKGGFDPTKLLTQECDCSGFIAWAIGIPRELPPGSGRWLDTDAYWNGGGSAAKAAGFPLFRNVAAADGEPGDVIVYPDQGGHQGHIGIISDVKENGQLRVIHCSRGNWKHFGDATRETDSAVWDIQAKTRTMRIDFDALRLYAGVTSGVLPVIDALDVATESSLRHSLLANDPTLQLVAAGKLQLSHTGKLVSGIATVQQAMNILARKHEEYAIDLGVNEASSGVFGPRTERALKELQKNLGLTQTGVLDSPTLSGLDELLLKASAEVEVDNQEVEVGTTITSSTIAAGTEPLQFEFSNEGNAWFASTLGERFYVGNRVPYKNRFGLMNTKSGPVYKPAEYADFGHWATFIYPTAQAESGGHFNCLNTYDRAGFTFGFLQFAAHVANGDFVQFFRELLKLEERTAYFPELELQNGRIVQRTEQGLIRLDLPDSSEPLKRYLNPSGGEVEPRELLSAARFIHWSQHSDAHRRTQVKIAVDNARQRLREAQQRMPLDGRNDKVCFVVMDILHQGRGTYAAMKAAIVSNNDAVAYEKLLQIGASDYPERIKTIKSVVNGLEHDGDFGTKKYSAATNDFV